jgi:ribulose bisphosphate carboxylase small subunit
MKNKTKIKLKQVSKKSGLSFIVERPNENNNNNNGSIKCHY